MDILVYLIGLSAMEIVLGIDNIVFISIVTGRLPKQQQPRARQIGLGMALIMRILLLFTLSFILSLSAPIFHWTDLGVPDQWFVAVASEEGEPDHARSEHLEQVNGVSWKDIILIVGGLFLIAKSVHEVHKKLEGPEEKHSAGVRTSLAGVLAQIVLLDLIFSLDSVITAVGMVPPGPMKLPIMVTAVVLAVIVMLIFSGPVSNFVARHPTVKMLALSFLILIGVMLVAEGIGTEINKGYIYFAMFFALLVEMLNLRVRSKSMRLASATT